MLLFPAGIDAKINASTPCIRTPLGSLSMTVHTSNGNVLDDKGVAVRVLPSGAFVYSSKNKHVEVEILQVVLPLPEPRFGVVDGYEAFVIRVRALESIDNLSIACRWTQLPVDATNGPESGECLDAQTWETSSTRVTIGTQDGETLAGRAKRGERLPAHLQTVFGLDTVIYLADGLSVPIPNLNQGELCQIHFIVAWAPQRINNDVATWLAVDREPEFILEQAGCADHLIFK
ncbi:MAG: hypothetical protein JNJ77_15210 [Planctomycetia bacterium]|nr:hypothetical protein [Planctomycetia bacterium]